MKRMLLNALMLGVMFAMVVAVLDSARLVAGEARPAVRTLAPGGRPIDATRANDSAVLAADRAFVSAVSKHDTAMLRRLLDADFTWTDTNGKTLTRAEVLQSLPAPGIHAGEGASVQEYTYGDVGVVEANAGRMHVLRLWVHRPAGWRELVYQEVESLAHPPTFTPGPGTDCINPCKSLPYKPKNATEAAALKGYMSLESASVAHSASAWDRWTTNEFFAASSNSNKTIDKPSRMAGLRTNKMAGVSPTPMTSAYLYDFPGAVVMISLHKPVGPGLPLYITRVLVPKQKRWVLALSYQTWIKPESAKKAN